jgi:hypothetical protein
MINNFVKIFLLGLSKVKVVQSFPGSLRLKIDGLEKVRYFFKDNEEIPLNFNFYRLYGIKNIEFSPHTANILIEYDALILRENQIVNWVTRLKEIIIQKFTSGEGSISQQIIDEIGLELIKEGYEMEQYRQPPPA